MPLKSIVWSFSMKTVTTLLSSVLVLISLDASSVAVTTSRLFLDPKDNSDTVRVLSTESEPQFCQSSIRATKITPDGKIAISKDQAKDEAKQLIRIAPLSFDLKPGQQQNVRVLFRRRPGIDNGEYIGLLSIRCTSGITRNQMAEVKPNIIHNVPVVVRTATMPIKAQIVSAKRTDKLVETTINIEGNRSITGDVQIIEKSSGDVIATRKNISIYSQTPQATISVGLTDSSTSALQVRFIENKKLGGRVNLLADVI